MKKFLLGSVGLAALTATIMGGPALAADLRTPPPPPPPPVAYYDWSGAYIGFNAGGIWYDVDRTFPNDPFATCQTTRPATATESSASTLARSGSGALGFWGRKRH